MKSILLASTVFFAVTRAALAADTVATDPMPDVAPSGFVWTGAYVGVQSGYAWAQSHYIAKNGSSADPDPAGLFGGIYAGYNRQLESNLVLGIDADLNFSGIDGQSDSILPDGTSDLDHKFASEVTWNGALRARLGYAVDRFMPYIAGGLSVAHYEFTLRHDDGSEHPREEADMSGWNIGAGVEYAATDRLLLRAEYRYTDYGSKEYDHFWSGTQQSNTDLTSNDIRLGIAYKF